MSSLTPSSIVLEKMINFLPKISYPFDEILLIRPHKSKNITHADRTYGLNRYARHDVAVKFVKGNHITMYEDPEIVQSVNEACEAI
jgi:hypothetical protein